MATHRIRTCCARSSQPEQVEQNARTYAEQAFKLLDRDKTIVRYNAEWLAKLNFADLIHLASNFTIQQFLTRENFKLRWENGDAVYLHETFYALMQGYDAFAMRSDVQVGGTDQLFNIVTAARKIMTFLGEKPNIAVIMGILPGTDGVVRMSKSMGNHIPIHAAPDDMYGKVMSVPDSRHEPLLSPGHTLDDGGDQPPGAGLAAGEIHPRDAKMKLAREIVSIFYDEHAAAQAEQAFVRVFQQGDLPEDMPDYKLQLRTVCSGRASRRVTGEQQERGTAHAGSGRCPPGWRNAQRSQPALSPPGGAASGQAAVYQSAWVIRYQVIRKWVIR